MKEFQTDEMSAVKDDEIEIDLLELLRAYRKKWKRILFVPTGALLSKTSYNEGQSVPGIAHALLLEAI